MNALPFASLSALPVTFRRLFRPVVGSGFALLLAAGLAAGVALPVAAQSARPGLISQAVNESDRVVLSGNTHRLATRAADQGLVPDSTPAERMLLLLKRSPDQELALRATIESLHDKNSPNFHKWLTPQQFGAQWGAADSDIAAVTAWLQSHGFTVAGPTAGRTMIEFSGNAGQVQSAFHTGIHSYLVNGETHHANASDPQIPAALAPIVAGITTLNDFHPRALARKGKRGVYDASTHKIRPDLTEFGSNYDFLYVGPSDAATIYNTPNKVLNPNYTGSTKIDGTGAIIGIIGDSNITVSQNLNYRKLFGLAPNAPTVIIDGGTNPGVNGDAVEAYLDTQLANGIAPGAKLYFYTAADTTVDYGLDLAISRAVNDNIADVLNLSFGECEGGLETSGNQYYESIWEQAAAQGISVTVSTGDSGSAGCDNPNKQTLAYYGLQVNGLASTPFNIAVGGTDFAVLAGPDGSGADFTKYVSENSDPTTLRSALGYIPEVPWNNSFQNFPPGSLSSSVPVAAPYDNIVGAGGGRSNCAVGGIDTNGNLTCTSGYPKPSWQSAPSALTPDKVRDLPDVSMFAANGYDYATWAICTDQDYDSSGTLLTDCTPDSNGNFNVTGVGGTSAAAPAFAGLLALVKQSTGERQGQADYVLYNLARGSSASAIFHDVTTSNNSVPCQAGTENCSKNSAGYYFLTGYNAGAGYDLASGLGSVDATALISNWASAGLQSTTTSLTLTPATTQHGLIVVADATVSGGPVAAAGQIGLSAKANPPSLPVGKSLGTYALTNGTTGKVNINSLPGGTYNVVASYSGSSQLSQSVSSPVAITITPEPSTTDVSFQAYDPTTGYQTSGATPYGYQLYIFGQPIGVHSPTVGGVVEPDGNATGTIAFAAGSKSLGSEPLGLNGYAATNAELLPAGTYTVSAIYKGDASFDASTGTKVLTVTKAPTKLTMAASATKYLDAPIVFTITMDTNSIGVAPTGTVQLKAGTSVIASGKLVGVAATSSTLASGSVTISTSNLPSTNSNVTAVYLGDTNYAASTSNGIEIAAKPSFTILGTSITLSSEHSTSAGTLQIASKGGYAGTINLTCKLATESTSNHPAECGMYPGTVTVTVNGTAAPEILIFGQGTKLPVGVSTSSNEPGGSLRWLSAGGAVLACCLLVGIPARRRSWQSMLAVILLLGSMVGFSACANKGKLVTAGKYTFTVTGVDSKDSTITTSATVKVTVL